MSPAAKEQLEPILIGLMSAAKSMALYPADHPSVQQPLQRCFRELDELLHLQGKVTLGLVDEVLVFEGVPFYSAHAAIVDLQRRFERLGVNALEIYDGLDPAELSAFIKLLNDDPAAAGTEGPLSKALHERGITHVMAKDAREVYTNAIDAVGDVLTQSRLGRIPHAGRAKAAVEDLKRMLTSDQPALIALTIIKSYDNYLFNHSVNVSVLALALAHAIRVPERDLSDIGLAGLLHDVGKTLTPKSIILKAGSLNDEEWKIMKEHPVKSEEIVRQMDGVSELVVRMVREHHVCFDLKGYPPLAPGQQPHPYSKIITVADCYDAITTLRPYQKPFHPREAMRIMERLAGRVLDPQYFEAFIKVLGIYPVGTLVRLDSNEVAVVVETFADAPLTPKIKIIFDPDGKPVAAPFEVNLALPASDPSSHRVIVATVDPLLYNVDPQVYL
jgi:putative nucleotidyltransferase with HDIG domain